MTRILLVEDEIAAADAFLEEVRLAALPASVDTAGSRTSAIERLEDVYDVVVCDLRIPSTDGGLDINEEHGVLVIRETLQRHPNIPIFILTGFGSLENIGALINQPIRDIYGSGQALPLVRWCSKKQYGQLIEMLRHIQRELDSLADVTVNIPELEDDDIRAVQVFARLKHAQIVDGHRATEGLSSAVPLSLRLAAPDGRLVASAFVKAGSDEAIEAEALRVRQYVDGVLPAGTYPPVTMVVNGSGRRAALCQAVVGEPQSLYDVLEADEERAIASLRIIERVESDYWLQGGRPTTVTVGDLRRSRRASDSLASELGELGHQSLEQETVEIIEAVQHGDLHGDNVLVDGQGATLMIDFAATGPAAVSLDPVVMDLSFLFHPRGRAVAGRWGDEAPIEEWLNAAEYLRDFPYPQFMAALREWVLRNGPKPALANAYAHAVRQLAHPGVDPARVRRLVAGLMTSWAALA